MLNVLDLKKKNAEVGKEYSKVDDPNELGLLEIDNLLTTPEGEKVGPEPLETRITTPNSEANAKETEDSKQSRCSIISYLQRILHPKTLCPTQTRPIIYVTYAIILLLFWGVMFTLLQDLASPRSDLFILFVLFLVAYLAGQILALVHLPPLLGMLITGIVLRNVGWFNVTGVYLDIVSALRKVALAVILTKAGLGLDAGALRRLSFVVLRLACGPCIMETVTAAVVSHYLLGFSWLWGFLLGLVLAAVSPAVVVPSLIGLKEKGYGEDKGISTLVIAASSIDDIIAISGFGVVLGSIFSQGSLTQQILQGPLEVLFGLSFGIIWGIIATYIPHKDDPLVTASRAFLVGGGGLFAVMGSHMIGYDGAGPLACIVAAFVACCGWKAQGWTSTLNPVANVFSGIWLIFQPILFGLIGTEINLSQLDGHTVWLGLAVLFIGLLIRVLTCFVVTLRSSLNLKERIFVAIAWFPKATVQAALGPVALDIARQNGASSEVVEIATQILTIAVLSILVTAPIGAVGIAVSGPRLLHRTSTEEEQQTQ